MNLPDETSAGNADAAARQDDLPLLAPRAGDASERLRANGASTAAGARGDTGRISMRVRRALREFLAVPAMVVAGYAALGALSIVIDKSRPHWLLPALNALKGVISKNAASALLSAIATSVVTVTSITFSVLLLAVQQTASSMSPAVFDQFLRRRTNQLYLGMFVGLSLYSFLVLSSVGKKSPAIFGASLALLLTVIAFLVLIVLIYSTVDQMRPSSVAQVIHDRALKAREAEMSLLRRTRRAPQVQGASSCGAYAHQDGYVTEIDLDAMVAAVRAGDVEVVLEITLGQHIVYGQRLALVRDDDKAAAERLAEVVGKAVRLDRARSLDTDASFAVAQLGNIAWTALSTAKQNPQTGRESVDRLRDLAVRWSIAEEPVVRDEDTLPVVYADQDLDEVLDSLMMLIVVCGESRQVESAAHVLGAVADALAAAPREKMDALAPVVARTFRALHVFPLTRPLEEEFRRLVAVLRSRDQDSVAELAEEYIAGLAEWPSPNASPPPR